jgi:hypothetical protein
MGRIANQRAVFPEPGNQFTADEPRKPLTEAKPAAMRLRESVSTLDIYAVLAAAEAPESGSCLGK